MANFFSKEERVAFEDILEGFNDALVLSRNVSIYNTDQTMMERTNNVIWRPMPYIAQSIPSTPGVTIAGSYQDMTQLSVPATIGFSRTVPWTMTSLDLRDALQEGRLGDAAKQKLASDINLAIMNVASAQGTLVVPVAGPATGYDDIAQADALMNEQGVQMFDRYAALSSRDYNAMAGNIANGLATVGARAFGGDKSNRAYERSFVGMVAGFETYKMDYANRIAAAGGAANTIDTQAGAGNFYVPAATSTALSGEVQNVDNRYQTITTADTTGVVAGDCFTIDGVEAVHHITKQGTGNPKTFRVIQVLPGGTDLVISPPIISAQGGSDAELQYQNCIVTPNAAANVNYINTGASAINPFWQKDALEILPGRYAIPSDSGAAIMRGTTDQGIELVMQKFYDINSMTILYRLDTLYGVVNKQPEMSGILLFNQ
jgi:hypothetical protein